MTDFSLPQHKHSESDIMFLSKHDKELVLTQPGNFIHDCALLSLSSACVIAILC